MRRMFIFVVVIVLLCTGLSGCGGGGLLGAALRIAGVKAIVNEGSDSGSRWVRILADIVSGNGLVDVIARILRDGSDSPTEIILTRNSEGQYEGSYLVEEAPTTEEISVEVTAEDAAGSTATSEPVTVEVPPTEPVQ